MSPFWIAVASKLTAELIGAAARSVRRKLSTPEIQEDLTAALQEAIERTLDSVPTPENLATFGDEGARHFHDLLARFLASDEVVDQLTLLVDPRPKAVPDFRKMVTSFEEEHRRSDLPDFDLKGVAA